MNRIWLFDFIIEYRLSYDTVLDDDFCLIEPTGQNRTNENKTCFSIEIAKDMLD